MFFSEVIIYINGIDEKVVPVKLSTEFPRFISGFCSSQRIQQFGDPTRQPSLFSDPQSDCGNSDIARCVELLEVLTSKDIGFAASREELDKMCPVLMSGLQCIDNYTRRCLSPQHRSYFNKLYNGTMLVIRDLCTTRGNLYQQGKN